MVQNRLCYFQNHGASGLALSADVSSSLADKANSADVYTSGAVDTLLSVKLVAADVAGKANSADVYNMASADGFLASKLESADVAGFAIASDVTSALANKLESADIAGLAVASNIYTKTEADALLADKLEASDVSGKLATSVFNTRVGVENSFITALKDGLFVESYEGSGVEYNYSDLNL